MIKLTDKSIYINLNNDSIYGNDNLKKFITN